MPDITLGELRVSDRLQKRLKALLYMTSEVLEIPCTLVNIQDNIVYQFPANHINSCFCKRLESVTGSKYSLNHFLERCHRVGIDANNSIYNCPFGLINILVPVFDANTYVAALQIGPFIVEDSEQLLLKHGLADLDVNSPSELLQDMMRYLRSLPKGTTDYLITLSRVAKTILSDDALDILLKIPETMDSQDKSNSGEYDLIYAIQQFVTENYANPDICLEMVARHVYVHSSYVSHIFSEKFNIGFRDYVNFLRVKQAKELLVNTNKPIGEICRSVGYSDHSYFNKIFKRWEGVTPTEYRNANKVSASAKSA
ncbi:MAG TPA: hypothetical protein DCP91_07940 [Eggerthellaceae bacterium]|nr:hypothetical protein [Eggerthellaceae bacterium]